MPQAWDNEAGQYNATVTNQESNETDAQIQTSHSSLQLPKVLHSATLNWEDSLSLSLTASSAAQLQRAMYSGNHRLPTRSKTRGSVTSTQQSKSRYF